MGYRVRIQAGQYLDGTDGMSLVGKIQNGTIIKNMFKKMYRISSFSLRNQFPHHHHHSTIETCVLATVVHFHFISCHDV